MASNPSTMRLSVFFLLIPAAFGLSSRAGEIEAQRVPLVASTVIRIARSSDGLTFQESDDVFLIHAASPDLEIVRKDRMVAVFDFAGVEEGQPPRSCVSQSNDGGRTWSPLSPIRMKRVRSDWPGPQHADLVRVGRSQWRLYFMMQRRGQGDERSVSRRKRSYIQSALTRNGLDYVFDRRMRHPTDSPGGAHPMAVWFGRRVHLYYEGGEREASASDKAQTSVQHLISRRGDRFAILRPVDSSGARFVGSLVRLPRGIRAYVSTPAGIVSYVSADGREWAREPGVRLPRGWDPAVTRLPDGSYLMLYCDVLDQEARSATVLVAESGADREEWTNFLAEEPEPPDEDDALEQRDEVIADASADDREDLDLADLADAEPETWDEEAEYQIAVNDEVADSNDAIDGEALVDEYAEEMRADPDALATDDQRDEPVGEDFDAPPSEGYDWMDTWDPDTADGFAPLPDFETKVDYNEWLREFGSNQPEVNAYDAYVVLTDDDKGAPEWPELNDMFHGDYEGPPIPWSPDDHPEWEATNQAMQDLVDKYREATEIEEYALPIEYSDAVLDEFPDRQPLLIGLRLPHLSRHRELLRATLADAWRVGEDGKVSSKKMIDAWRTTLRGASHMTQGSTLIEDLVGLAERAQVQENARWALRHGVFKGGELEGALDTLREYDRGVTGMSTALRGEHAFAMDITQYLFAPKKRGDAPQPRLDRIEAIIDTSWFDDGSKADDAIANIAAMGPQEIRNTVDAFTTHYRELEAQMSIGYPDVRASDVAAIEARHVHTSPVTEMFLPALSRYYHLQARGEASRRATQLAYATHIFKEHNGRWPSSLSELPAEFGETMRTDPFSGDYFGYRVTEDGPTIYSASENGVDDGGVHSPRWADKIDNEAGSDDHVFWPPQPK